MKLHTFSGGIDFDPSMKKLKQRFHVSKKDVAYFEPTQVAIPLTQNIGAPNEAVVAVGDQVVVGQVIAKSSAFVSGRVHASISGNVTGIKEVPALGGGVQKAILIERNSSEKATEKLLPENLAPLEAIQAAGIVGLGGATFPTHVKLSPPNHQSIEYVILNGTECEPFLSSDDYLMQKESEKILQGGEIARNILGAKYLLISVEEDTPEAFAVMNQTAKELGLLHCKVLSVPITYPQGGEGQLVQTLLGREIPFGGLPGDVGVVLLNVATAFGIAQAVNERKALTRRFITVTGTVNTPQVVSFPFGTMAQDLLAFCGGTSSQAVKILQGGPMMGRTLPDLDTPLTKGANGLLVLSDGEVSETPEQPCIRCNRCVEVCPVNIEPQNIDLAYRVEDLFTCEQLVATRCINCGCCTYVCPARRNLASNITKASNKIKQIKKELADNDKK